MARLATREAVASGRCDCLAQPLPGDVPCRCANEMPDVGPGKVPGRRLQDMPDGAAGGVPVRPLHLRIASDTAPRGSRQSKRARQLVYTRGPALVPREEPRDIPARKPWEMPDVGGDAPGIPRRRPAETRQRVVQIAGPCEQPQSTWTQALALTYTGLGQWTQDPALWPWELASLVAHRPVGLSFGATGFASSSPGPPDAPRDELFTMNGEFVYAISRVKLGDHDQVARARWPLPRCTTGLWRDSSGDPIVAPGPTSTRESWAPISAALAHVSGDTATGRRESVVLPYGRGGEFGLARLMVGDRPRPEQHHRPDLDAQSPTWEIYPAHMYSERALSVSQTGTYAGIAAVGDLVFVALYNVGVAVWRRSASISADAYECIGLLRVPLWLNTPLPVTDLVARDWMGSTYLFAAVQANYPTPSVGQPIAPPTTRTPRAFVWRLDQASLNSQVGLEQFPQNVGVPIDGLDSRPAFSAPGSTWMVFLPLVRAPAPAVPPAPAVVGRPGSVGINTSVVAGNLALWLSTAESLDVLSLAGIATPGALGTSVTSQQVIAEAAALEAGLPGTLRILDEGDRLGGLSRSAGPVGGCGGPAGSGVLSDYCNTLPGFGARPSIAGPIAVVGNFTGVAGEAWVAGLAELAQGSALIKLGVTQRFPAGRGAMTEFRARMAHGRDPAVGWSPASHYVFGPVKAHLGRVDLRIPDPGSALTALVAAVQGPPKLLSPGAPLCTPACSNGGLAGSGIDTAAYGSPLSGQVRVGEACLPATPIDTSAPINTQYPANACAVFADEGLPPLVGWGYGGEWMDATPAESRRHLSRYVVFLADRASGAVHAHRCSLADGVALDVFPGYDPRETDPAYIESVWPSSFRERLVPKVEPAGIVPFTDSLGGYFPARNRVKGCRSVAVTDWPGASADATLVAAVGKNDPELALYMIPWRWLDPSQGAGGEFVYDEPNGDKLPVRFPFDPGGGFEWWKDGDIGGVRTISWRYQQETFPLFLVFFELLRPVTFSTAPALVPDIALVDPRSMTATVNGSPAFVSGGSPVFDPVVLPRVAGFLTVPRGPLYFTILDARDATDRVYLLGRTSPPRTPPATRPPEFWILTMEKVYATPPDLTAHSFVRLPTIHNTSETQRIKVSPDGRWIVATFGSAFSGYMLLHVPQTGGALGTPEVVAGLRVSNKSGARLLGSNFRLWEYWAGPTKEWLPTTEAYTRTQRGQDGLTRAPLWPLPDLPGGADVGDPLLEQTFTGGWVGAHGGGAEFFQTDAGLLLSIDTDPITIWRIDPNLVSPSPSLTHPPAPWLYVGALPSEGSQRQRVAWATPEGVFHLGDTGNWAWPACDPLHQPPRPCPVKP